MQGKCSRVIITTGNRSENSKLTSTVSLKNVLISVLNSTIQLGFETYDKKIINNELTSVNVRLNVFFFHYNVDLIMEHWRKMMLNCKYV